MAYPSLSDNLDKVIDLEYVVRCPACHNGPLEFTISQARCPTCQRTYVQQSGYLDFLPLDNILSSLSHKVLESPLLPRFVDRWTQPFLSRLIAQRSHKEQIELALDLLRLKRGHSVLDLECGNGVYARQIANLLRSNGFVVGLDRSGALLQQAEAERAATRLDNLYFIRGDGLHLPFMSDSFDRVHCAGSIHLMRDIPRAIAEIHRVLREGGLLVLNTFVSSNRPLLRTMRNLTRSRAGGHWFPPIELERLLTSSRFVIDWHSTSGYSLTLRAVAYK